LQCVASLADKIGMISKIQFLPLKGGIEKNVPLVIFLNPVLVGKLTTPNLLK